MADRTPNTRDTGTPAAGTPTGTRSSIPRPVLTPNRANGNQPVTPQAQTVSPPGSSPARRGENHFFGATPRQYRPTRRGRVTPGNAYNDGTPRQSLPLSGDSPDHSRIPVYDDHLGRSRIPVPSPKYQKQVTNGQSDNSPRTPSNTSARASIEGNRNNIHTFSPVINQYITNNYQAGADGKRSGSGRIPVSPEALANADRHREVLATEADPSTPQRSPTQLAEASGLPERAFEEEAMNIINSPPPAYTKLDTPSTRRPLSPNSLLRIKTPARVKPPNLLPIPDESPSTSFTARLFRNLNHETIKNYEERRLLSEIGKYEVAAETTTKPLETQHQQDEVDTRMRSTTINSADSLSVQVGNSSKMPRKQVTWAGGIVNPSSGFMNLRKVEKPYPGEEEGEQVDITDTSIPDDPEGPPSPLETVRVSSTEIGEIINIYSGRRGAVTSHAQAPPSPAARAGSAQRRRQTGSFDTDAAEAAPVVQMTSADDVFGNESHPAGEWDFAEDAREAADKFPHAASSDFYPRNPRKLGKAHENARAAGRARAGPDDEEASVVKHERGESAEVDNDGSKVGPSGVKSNLSKFARKIDIGKKKELPGMPEEDED